MLQNEQAEGPARGADQIVPGERPLLHVLQHAERPSTASGGDPALTERMDIRLRGDALGENDGKQLHKI